MKILKNLRHYYVLCTFTNKYTKIIKYKIIFYNVTDKQIKSYKKLNSRAGKQGKDKKTRLKIIHCLLNQPIHESGAPYKIKCVATRVFFNN